MEKMNVSIQENDGHKDIKRWLSLVGLGAFFLFTSTAVASENERYQAIPTSPSGPILIVDTQEGHLWTWNNNGTEETNTAGVNPRIRYQGNVRQNMKPPAPPSASQGNFGNDSERF